MHLASLMNQRILEALLSQNQTSEESSRNTCCGCLITKNNTAKKCWTIQWVKFIDENTKKIQAVATKRYRVNNIANLQTPDGLSVDDHTGKEALLFQAYSERLGTSNETEMKFDLPSLIRTRVNLDHLTTPFTTTKIDAVIQEMPMDRAPGWVQWQFSKGMLANYQE